MTDTKILETSPGKKRTGVGEDGRKRDSDRTVGQQTDGETPTTYPEGLKEPRGLSREDVDGSPQRTLDTVTRGTLGGSPVVLPLNSWDSFEMYQVVLIHSGLTGFGEKTVPYSSVHRREGTPKRELRPLRPYHGTPSSTSCPVSNTDGPVRRRGFPWLSVNDSQVHLQGYRHGVARQGRESCKNKNPINSKRTHVHRT